MSDTPMGEGWWQASDGKWYPADQHPEAAARGNSSIGDRPVVTTDPDGRVADAGSFWSRRQGLGLPGWAWVGGPLAIAVVIAIIFLASDGIDVPSTVETSTPTGDIEAEAEPVDETTPRPGPTSTVGAPPVDETTPQPGPTNSQSDSAARVSYAENLGKDECIDPIDSDGYTTVRPCSDAQLKVLVVIQMPDSGWPGGEHMRDSADEFCPDETSFKYWPDELDWIFGDRHILCLVNNSPGDTGEFDSGSLAGRWLFAGGYLDLELSSSTDTSEGRVSIYRLDEYSLNGFGLNFKVGSGELIARPDGSAELAGTNDLLVFVCFDDAYEGTLSFTDSEFFGSIWCKGDPSDPAQLRGFRN